MFRKTDWTAKQRTNAIGALNKDKLLTAALFDGNITTDVFEEWRQHGLRPVLPNGAVVVMDNASFHKFERIQEAVEAAGCLLEYLPPYSPDLNPIEHKWAQAKALKKSCAARPMNFLSNHACSQFIVLRLYMYNIAQSMIDEAGEGFKAAHVNVFRKRAQEAIFADIDATLKRIGIVFDSYYNEHDLYEKGLIDDVVATLRAKGLVYEQDGATWFKTTEFGQAQDRVIIKNTGEPTYRLPDIAYHREKFRRGFERMINVFGRPRKKWLKISPASAYSSSL